MEFKELVDAIYDGNAVEVRRFIAAQGVNAADDHGDTALHVAAEAGKMAMIDLLVELGADVNKRGAKGATPLFWAYLNGRLAVAQRLLDLGADLTARTDLGETVLHYAARNLRRDAIPVLLDSGVDPDIKDHEGTTALHLLAAKATRRLVQNGGGYKHIIDDFDERLKPEIMRMLLKRGARVDDTNNRGCTSLHLASKHWADVVEPVRLLLEHGADPNVADCDGRYPLDYALEVSTGPAIPGGQTEQSGPNLKIAALLGERGAKAAKGQ